MIVNDRCAIHFSRFQFLAPFDLAVGGAILFGARGDVAILALISGVWECLAGEDARMRAGALGCFCFRRRLAPSAPHPGVKICYGVEDATRNRIEKVGATALNA